MDKRSPEEVLKALDAWDEDDAIDAEMQRVAAMTPDELKEELRAAGVDVEAEQARARALYEQHASRAAGDKSVEDLSAEPAAWVTQAAPSRRTRPATRWAVLLAAALGATATGGGVLYALAHRPKPNDKPVEVPHEVPTVTPPAPPPRDIPKVTPPTNPDNARDIKP
jgi:hypothetical protein